MNKELLEFENDLKSGKFDHPNDIYNDLSANEKQIAGKHYVCQTIQAWDYIVSNNIGFLEGNVIKYVSRYKSKNGVEDLKKAMHYLEKLIEVENERNNQSDY